ncbi:hypothetical protein CBR_g45479 [Chara braunii]|uniref:DNA primase large subunit n=1 Tax=Chara braunii TaxID=69332 RepID=A0A388LYW2_CHABU|nr:hypothetical protein CBR_g45479 [Chara braunii]|eukprot:GBG87422.1 hypothetical protein CBR_g45479 [Chara braunii]
MYQTPPSEEVTLESLEEFALDRLRVLKSIEDAKSRGKRPDEMDALVHGLWRKHMRCATPAETAQKDVVSHFILRLAYCLTEELRRWFLAMESFLFRHRFRIEGPDVQKKFLEDSDLPYQAISAAEYGGVRDKLAQVARSVGAPIPQDDSIYYKVQFEEVTELVAFRRVYINKGFAFVPRDHLSTLVVGHFRSRLSKALVFTNRQWAFKVALEEKDRLAPIVEALSTRYLGPNYAQPHGAGAGGAGGDVRLQDLDALAFQSFPLCMRHLHVKLKDDHHLRHGGRMQLGLFLKGIGLKLEDALAFWRSEFGKGVGVEKFDKEYAYNVRHNYGKEGKRTDYTPYSCVKIIKQTPGVGDHHGCPYRHFSEENLRAALGSLRLDGRTTDEIMGKVRGCHYQLACAQAFEAVHGCSCDTGINHPNQYFEQSRKVLQPPAEEEGKGQRQHNDNTAHLEGEGGEGGGGDISMLDSESQATQM